MSWKGPAAGLCLFFFLALGGMAARGQGGPTLTSFETLDPFDGTVPSGGTTPFGAVRARFVLSSSDPFHTLSVTARNLSTGAEISWEGYAVPGTTAEVWVLDLSPGTYALSLNVFTSLILVGTFADVATLTVSAPPGSAVPTVDETRQVDPVTRQNIALAGAPSTSSVRLQGLLRHPNALRMRSVFHTINTDNPFFDRSFITGPFVDSGTWAIHADDFPEERTAWGVRAYASDGSSCAFRFFQDVHYGPHFIVGNPDAAQAMLPPNVLSVSPNVALGGSRTVFALTGTGFQTNGTITAVALEDADTGTTLAASSFVVTSDSLISATVDFPAGTAGGSQNVKVTRSDGRVGTSWYPIRWIPFELREINPTVLSSNGTQEVRGFYTGLEFLVIADDYTISIVHASSGAVFPLTNLNQWWEGFRGDVVLASAPPGGYDLQIGFLGTTARIPGVLQVTTYTLLDTALHPPHPSVVPVSDGTVTQALLGHFDPAQMPSFSLRRAGSTTIAATTALLTDGATVDSVFIQFDWNPVDAGVVGTWDLVLSQAGVGDRTLPGALAISDVLIEQVSPMLIPNERVWADGQPGDVVQITGSGFQTGAVVRLTWIDNPWSAGYGPPEPVEYTAVVASAELLTFRKDRPIAPGRYLLQVVNPGGLRGELVGVPVGTFSYEIHATTWETIRVGRQISGWFFIRNTGDITIPAQPFHVALGNLFLVDPTEIPPSFPTLPPGEVTYIGVTLRAPLPSEMAAGSEISPGIWTGLFGAVLTTDPPVPPTTLEATKGQLEIAVASLEASAAAKPGSDKTAIDLVCQIADLVQELFNLVRDFLQLACDPNFSWYKAYLKQAEFGYKLSERLLQLAGRVGNYGRAVFAVGQALYYFARAATAGAQGKDVEAALHMAAYHGAFMKAVGFLVEASSCYNFVVGFLHLTLPKTVAFFYSGKHERCGGPNDDPWPRDPNRDRPNMQRPRIGTSLDPNDMIVTNQRSDVEYDGSGLVTRVVAYAQPEERVGFLIRFENKATAAFPALEITIDLPLDPAFDPASVEFGQSSHPSALTRAFVDTGTSPPTLRWRFNDINLPPNVTPAEGEGFVLFTAKLKAGLASGTRATNRASIVFDPTEGNPTIVTNPVDLIVDSGAPSLIEASVLSRSAETIRLRVDGSDSASGIDRVEIFARARTTDPFGLQQEVVLNSPTEVDVPTPDGSLSTEFYAVAIDKAGNESSPRTAVDAPASSTGGGGGGGGGGCASRESHLLPGFAMIVLAFAAVALAARVR